MCTLALYFGLLDNAPLLVAANRDEHYDRASAEPSLFDALPRILAGRDLRAGGTWLGVNEFGLAVGILNRRVNGAPVPQASIRSRGLLCMDLLAHHSATGAAAFIEAHDALYNPFTVMVADRGNAFAAYNHGAKIATRRLAVGLHVFSSAAEGDIGSPKAVRAHDKFAAALPDHGASVAPASWIASLKKVLADHDLEIGSNDPGDAICVHRQDSGTVSSSIVVLSDANSRFEMFHCPGPPCQNDFNSALLLDVHERQS
jgi:uncharacterized protein with NRDE domain